MPQLPQPVKVAYTRLLIIYIEGVGIWKNSIFCHRLPRKYSNSCCRGYGPSVHKGISSQHNILCSMQLIFFVSSILYEYLRNNSGNLYVY